MAVLVKPDVRYKAAYIECVREFQAEKNPRASAYMQEDITYLEQHFDRFVAWLEAQQVGKELPEGYVDSSKWWLLEGEDILGVLHIRHRLNEFLLNEGGHIGYNIKESWRGKGYGHEILRLGLNKAVELEMPRVLLTCDESNASSRTVIERQGGMLEDVREIAGKTELKRRYWIDTGFGYDIKLQDLYEAKVIVWDMDETLVDLEIDWNGFAGVLRAAVGEDLPSITLGFGHMYNWAVNKDASYKKRLDEAALRFEESRLKGLRRNPHIEEFVKRLSQKPQAVWTSQNQATAQSVLTNLGLKPYFKIIVGKERVNRLKPDPGGWLVIRDALQAHEESTVMVGNSPEDREAAWRSGLRYFDVKQLMTKLG